MFSISLLISGCATTIKRQLEMRKELKPAAVKENVQVLLKNVNDDPSDPAIFNFALETLIIIANKGDLNTVDKEQFNNMRKMFIEYAKNKKFSNADDWIEAGYRCDIETWLRAYFIYALTNLDHQDSFALYLDILGNRNFNLATQLYAIKGLKKTQKLYAGNNNISVQIMLKILALKVMMSKQQVYNIDQLHKAVKWLESRHLNIKMLNYFWANKPSKYYSNSQTLDMLKLNYQLWKYLIANKRKIDKKLLQKNIDLVMHFSASKIGNQADPTFAYAEKMLIDTIPQAYYQVLLNKTKDIPQLYFKLLAMQKWIFKNEDNMTMTDLYYTNGDGKRMFNSKSIFGSDRFDDFRDDTVTLTNLLLRRIITRKSISTKQKFYRQIAQTYPVLLAKYLCDRLNGCDEPFIYLQQDFCFAWHLAQNSKLNTIWQQRLIQQSLNIILKGCKRRDYRKILDLCSAYYLKSSPGYLVRHIDLCFKSYDKISDLYALTDLYIRSLESLRKKNKDALDEGWGRTRKTFAIGIKSRQRDVASIICPYLSKHDPVFLISTIEDNRFDTSGTSNHYSDFKLLADQVVINRQYLESKAGKKTRYKALNIFNRNANVKNNEISLLASASYLQLVNKNDPDYRTTIDKIVRRWPVIKFRIKE
jgi:hypothetical protein